MPLPLIILAISAAAAGIAGVKKGYNGIKKNSEAEKLINQAHGIFNQAQEDLTKIREKTLISLEALGKIKRDIWNSQMKRFVEIYSQIHAFELTGEASIDELGPMSITPNELAQMRDLCMKAGEITVGGLMSAGAGALASVGVYGGAAMLASASTGTAIASLTGVASTNATLAWLGGGSLAAGGMGIAGGIMVLGGICLAPTLLVGGIFYESKARTKYEAAERTMDQARQNANEMKRAIVEMYDLKNVALEFNNLILKLDSRMTIALDRLEYGTEFGTDYSNYKERAKSLVNLTERFAQVMKLLIETPLLDQDGSTSHNYHAALDDGYNLLNSSEEEMAKL